MDQMGDVEKVGERGLEFGQVEQKLEVSDSAIYDDCRRRGEKAQQLLKLELSQRLRFSSGRPSAARPCLEPITPLDPGSASRKPQRLHPRGWEISPSAAPIAPFSPQTRAPIAQRAPACQTSSLCRRRLEATLRGLDPWRFCRGGVGVSWLPWRGLQIAAID